MEVAYHTLTIGDFANRGFLRGPVCPIYGFGAAAVLTALIPFKNNLLILFVASALLTSAIEFITGFVLDKVFKNKWWDYSDIPFNLCGYICLKFSVVWGFVCVFAVRIIHPIIAAFVSIIPHQIGVVILLVLYLLFIIDIILTIFEMVEFKKQLNIADKLSKDLYAVSDALGMKINNSVLHGMELKSDTEQKLNSLKSDTKQIYEKVKDDMSEREVKLRNKYSLLASKYKSNIDKIASSHQRWIKAFPSMKSRINSNAIEIIKKRINVHDKNR